MIDFICAMCVVLNVYIHTYINTYIHLQLVTDQIKQLAAKFTIEPMELNLKHCWSGQKGDVIHT